MNQASRQIECAVPVLAVKDLSRSICFFTEKLGFRLDWGGEPGKIVCSVSKDSCCIMLKQFGEEVATGWIWIGVRDHATFDRFRKAGVAVLQEPKNFSWAYEMKFLDPDGNVLWCGTASRQDLPLED